MSDLEEIQKAWRNRNLIPFVGSGVSQSAAGLPTWSALLQKGIEHLKKNQKKLKLKITVIRAIASAAKADKLTDGFRMLQDALGGPKSDAYRGFLLEQFDKPVVTNRKILDAIAGLGARVVVTTNYDKLLEDYKVVPGNSIATWLEPRDIFALLRGGQGVIHLHGLVNYPESVILSTADYERIVHGPEASIKVSQALFHSGILLFIGCSIAGVDDRHLSTLLEEFAKIQGPLLDRSEPHFILFKKDVSPEELGAAGRLGLKPIIYGDTYDSLPEFLRKIPDAPSVSTDDVRLMLQTLAGAQSLQETFNTVQEIIMRVIYPGRKIRIGFAAKTEEKGKVLLSNKYLLPVNATHNNFSYPLTLAAWALVEGKILSVPDSLEQRCDFDLLKKLKKAARIKETVRKANPTDDPVMADFLNLDEVKRKTQDGTLTIGDIYQNWVGRQPKKHYGQFVSVPVPIIERITNDLEPPEYGVFNIDSPEVAPLVTDATSALLKLVSDAVAVAFKLFAVKSATGA
jgi:SIR2-like domain